MSQPEYKKKINAIYMRPSTFNWLIGKANKGGELIGDMAGLLLDHLAESDMMDAYDPDDGTTDVMDYRWLERDEARNARVRRAAMLYSLNPTLEGDERFTRMCDRVGISRDEVLAEVEADPFSAIIARNRSSSKRTECIMWLPKFIMDHDNAVHSTVIYATAKMKGFSSSTIERAKTDINVDPSSPCIVSGLKGKGVWSVTPSTDEEVLQAD